jgi:hypothetical protein
MSKYARAQVVVWLGMIVGLAIIWTTWALTSSVVATIVVDGTTLAAYLAATTWAKQS